MRHFRWISIIALVTLFGCGDCDDNDNSGPETDPETSGPWTPEVCDSTQDDDGDGFADCLDSDCFTHELCVFEPAVVAPDLPLNGVVTLWDRSRWFFEDGKVQRGLTPNKITPLTIGTVRGRVVDTIGVPLAAAAISIANDAEFGRTYTRADGLFDFAYATTDRLVLRVTAKGHVTSDRVLRNSNQGATSLEDIVLVPLEGQATQVDFSKTQLVSGAQTEDADGARRTAAIFPKGVSASLVFPNGDRRDLKSLHVRLTEVTVGDDGRRAMMAELPPTSLYTYAAEFTVDEAVAEFAERVEFSEPVFVYVDNFLDFDAGTLVPSGFYDRRQTVWEPMPNGLVLDVLEISSGRAVLSAGDGPLGAEEKSKLGITDDELQELATLVKAGDSVWRVPTTHFSPFDFNWGGFYPPGTAPSPAPSDTFPDSCTSGQEAGSIIGCSNQTLGERIPLNGTPFELTYQSSRVAGRKPVIKVPVRPSGASLPIAAKVSVTAAGQRLDEREFLDIGAVPNIEEFIWDGLDGFGRPIQGAAEVEIEVALVYPAPYVGRSAPNVLVILPTGVTEFPPEFGSYPAEDGVQVGLDRALVVIKRKYTQTIKVGTYDVAREGLGGWTIGPQHRYDPVGRVMYYGNGQDLVAGPNDRVFEVISDGEFSFERPADGSIAKTSGTFGGGLTQAIGPDGTIYVHDTFSVRAIDPTTNEIHTIAGKFPADFVPDWTEESGDGEKALDARFNYVERIRVGKDGRLYIQSESAIWRVDADKTIHKMIGGGDALEIPDGMFATDVNGSWAAMDITADGTVYFANG